jgi:hypothetical protein
MREFLWLSGIIGLNLLAAWLVTGPWLPRNSFAAALVGAFFIVPSFGAFWMMYIAIRYEATPGLFVLIALIPYACVWYYVERYRSGRYLTRRNV